jgi:hypothetical protein
VGSSGSLWFFEFNWPLILKGAKRSAEAGDFTCPINALIKHVDYFQVARYSHIIHGKHP